MRQCIARETILKLELDPDGLREIGVDNLDELETLRTGLGERASNVWFWRVPRLNAAGRDRQSDGLSEECEEQPRTGLRLHRISRPHRRRSAGWSGMLAAVTTTLVRSHSHDS